MAFISRGGRILKNTLYLYFRMMFLTLISLYTIRIILNVLGASDYGLYNVVGGFVSLLGFFSATVTTAIQRFYSVCLARKEWEKLQEVFSCSMLINIFLSFLILLGAETVGVYFITHEMYIPEGRMLAAIIVFEFSVLTFIAGIMQSSFLGILVAEENFSVYSYVSIIEGFSKLGIAYLLQVSIMDHLILYAFLLCISSIVVDLIYIVYCFRNYNYAHFKMCRKRQLYMDIFSFINWNTIGAVAAVLKDQGVNIIINIFFGTTVNAARAVAIQINGVVLSFAQNFMNAVNPQIIKSYANGENKKFVKMICSSVKISYCLLLIIVLPLIANIEYVLGLWLIHIPQYTEYFVTLVLIDALLNSITNPFMTAVQAIGKVKWYQLTVGTVALLNAPISFLWLQYAPNPLIPFYVSIGVSFLMGILRIINFCCLYNFPIATFCKDTLLRIVATTIVTASATRLGFENAIDVEQFLYNCMGIFMITVIVIYLIGLTRLEKDGIKHIWALKMKRG